MIVARAFRLPKETCLALKALALESGKTQTQVIAEAFALWQLRYEQHRNAVQVEKGKPEGANTEGNTPKIQAVVGEQCEAGLFLDENQAGKSLEVHITIKGAGLK